MKALLASLGVALVATAALAATAPAAPAQQTAMNDTIVGVAAGDARFSTLVSLVKKAGLVGTLSAKGPYTVFAPTNAAFAKLKKTRADDLRRGGKRQGAAEEGAHLPRPRQEGREPGAPSPPRRRTPRSRRSRARAIKLSLKGGKLYLNGNSQVIVADVAASNGVIHAINTVLVPPSAG